MDVAAEIRDTRRAAGLTQFEASVLSGVPLTTLRDIEQRRTKKPTDQTVRSVLDAIRRYQDTSPATSAAQRVR